MNTDGIATSAESIKAKVKEYILKEFLPGENPESIGGSTELIDSGILDSLATLKLVSFIEDEYDIVLEPHQIEPQNLSSINAISDLVLSKRG